MISLSSYVLGRGGGGHITLLNDSHCIAVFADGCKKTQLPSALAQPFLSFFMYGLRKQCPDVINTASTFEACYVYTMRDFFKADVIIECVGSGSHCC